MADLDHTCQTCELRFVHLIASELFGVVAEVAQEPVQLTAYSAGSHPSGMVRPEALKQLDAARIPTTGCRSKSWEEFSEPDAPKLDFVFTVCDSAAKEVCPIWPGQPVTAHWGVPDPAAATGTEEEIQLAYRDAFFMLERRISLFLCLPLASIDGFALKKELDNIGRQ
jgi:arsenate reductase